MSQLAIRKLVDFVRQENIEQAKAFVEDAEKEVALFNIVELDDSEKESLRYLEEIVINVKKGSIKSASKKIGYGQFTRGYQGLIHRLQVLKNKQSTESGTHRRADGDGRSKRKLPNAQGSAKSAVAHQRKNAATVPVKQTETETKGSTHPDYGRDHTNKHDLENRETGNQRSKQISEAVHMNNPDIADLSDKNRPAKIAERFSELYDNEWTDVVDAVGNKKSVEEKAAIDVLLKVVQNAYEFCKLEADFQIKSIQSAALNIITWGRAEAKSNADSKLEATDDDHLKEFRKQHAGHAIPRLQKDSKLEATDEDHLKEFRKQHAGHAIPRLQRLFFDQVVSKTHLEGLPSPDENAIMNKFAEKAVELCWWMNVNNPPVYMCPTDMETFDANLYRAYTKSGNQPMYFVWPALKLHKDGGILAKGVVQFE